MNPRLREKSGRNMHYLLIIKIKGGINKPERKGTFVLSQARFPAFYYPSAWIFVCFDSRTSQSVPLDVELGPEFVRY